MHRVAVVSCLLVVGAARAEDVTKLQEVVVEGGFDAAITEAELPLGTSVSGEALRRVPGSGGDPLRAVQSLPGMTYADDAMAEPAVRGSRPGDNLAVVDFLPSGYLYHSGGVVSVFHADLIESFSLYPSTYGPEYSGVTGAVADIRLRDPRQDELGGNLDISILQAGLLAEGPVAEGQSFYLAGRMSYLDLLVEDQIAEDEGIEFRQFPKYSDYQSKYVWRPTADTSLKAFANGAADLQEVIISEDSDIADTEPLLSGRFYNDASFHQQGVLFEKDGRTRFTSALGHMRSSNVAQVGEAGDVDIVTDGWTLRAQVETPLNASHDLKSGVELSNMQAAVAIAFSDPACTEFEADCSLSGAERISTERTFSVNRVHLFAKDQWYLNDRLTLMPGLVWQGDDYLDDYYFEPRLALEYSAGDSTVFSLGAGLYHQMPQFQQIDAVFGNPDLESFRAQSYVAGVRQTLPNGWDWQAELFYKSLDKLIVGDDALRYTNAGEGSSVGLDLLVRKSMSEKLSGWLALSLSKSERTNTVTGQTFDFEFDQPYNLSLVLDYRFSELWSLSGKLWLHSGNVYTPIVGATEDPQTPGRYDPIYAELNSDRLPDYSRVDLRLERNFPRGDGKRTQLYFEIMNLLDQDNVSDYDYNADYSEREEVTQLPRIIGIGFQRDF